MKTIDLHVHSYYSDGEESPRSLLASAIGKGFRAFSITDHNYISPEQNLVQKIAEEQGVLFIQGIEVSCIDRETKESLHILGYSDSFNFEKVNKKIMPIVAGYNERAKKIIEKLNRKYSAGFDFEEIINEVPSVYVSRNQLAQKLSVFLGGKFTPRELLSEVFVEEDDSWMPNAQEAIEIIKESNGVAILAHPGNLVDNIQFDDLIKRLVGFGLKGIEAYTPKHTPGIIDILKKTAEKYNLILTAGSDWHGRHLSKEEEGMEVPDRIYNRLSEIFGHRKSSPARRALMPIGLLR
jgi:hypothetical protein